MSTLLLANVNSPLAIVSGMDSKDTFRDFIEARIKELGISQNEASRRSGRSGAWLSKLLSGERKTVNLDTFVKLANALQVSAQDLIAAYQGQTPEGASNREDLIRQIDEIRKTVVGMPPEERKSVKDHPGPNSSRRKGGG